MASNKSIPRPRPVTSVPPTSPRTEDSQGYRRGRAIRSCLECRRRKMRCNRSRPCLNCNRFCRECVYLPFPEWPPGTSSSAKKEGALQSPVHSDGRAYPSSTFNHSSGYIQPPPFTSQDYAYDPDTLAKHDRYYDTDADDDSVDMALQIGRLSITAKTETCFKPHITAQIAALLSQTNPILDPYNSSVSYGLRTSQHSMQSAAPSTLVMVKRILPLEPSPGLLTTNSQNSLPQTGPELPNRNELNFLYHQYWYAVDPLAHIVYRPTFEGESRKYLIHGQVIDAAPASFKALLLAMCLAAAVSLSPSQVKEMLGVPQQALVGRFKIATEKALTNASFMTSVKIQTLQAFTVYLIPQCRAEISKSHGVYVKALIRLAMGASLNREPSGPGIGPVDCQVRRLLWHQICFLDLLVTEAQGPQPTIRDDQFDTLLPLDVNDDALGHPLNESAPAPLWTDATFSIIRYECCMVHRLINSQRLAIELGQVDLKTVQHLVNVRKTRIERQYLSRLDDSIPIQRCAKLVGQLFTSRFDAMLLNRHSRFDVNNGPQAEVRELLIQSTLTVCECAVQLDADPDLTPWVWYARAHHQYHGSIFLLMEVHRDPLNPYAERSNRIIDHVFGTAPNLGSRDRSRHLLQLLAEEINKMMQLRKVKIPQLAVSENGSCSPNDHSSGLATTPEDGQPWAHWQPEPLYGGHGYRRDLPPVTDGTSWWPIPMQSGVLCEPTISHHDDYAHPTHDDYGYSMGLDPV